MVSARRITRALAIAVPALALAYVGFAFSFANTMASRSPALAAQIWPGSSRAKLAVAQTYLTKTPTRGPAPGQADALATAVLMQEPANAVAARTAANARVLMGKRDAGERLFRYAETMSRRDLPTELWLIESAIGRNDVRRALTHYDRALRVSLPIRDMLYPVLVGASADPELTGDIAALVAKRHNWWSSFFDALLQQSKDARAVHSIASGLKLDPAVNEERARLSGAMRLLVDLSAPDFAWDLYTKAMRSSGGSIPILRNGQFEAEPLFVPFDWMIRQGEEGRIVRAEGANGSNVLSFINTGPGDDIIQLVRLTAGTYRLGAVFGAIPAETTARPTLSATCVNSENKVLARIVPAPGSAPQRITADFVNPEQCRFVRVAIAAGANIDTGVEAPWIDEVSVGRR